MTDYEKWLPFAKTDSQTKKLKACIEHGSMRKAAKFLGIHHSAISKTLKIIELHAMLRGWSPEHDQIHPVPETQVIKGISTYYNNEGKPSAQWVKTSANHEALLNALKEAVNALKEDITPQEPIDEADGPDLSKLSKEEILKEIISCGFMNALIITDLHLGMLSWGKEGGRNWNIKMAEETLKDAIEDIIYRAPKADTGLLCFLGDFLHYDSLDSITPKNKNPLDSDSRYRKMIRVAVRCIKNAVNEMLKTHKQVKLVIAEGNHDIIGSQWLQELFSSFYENEPRVQIIINELPYYCVVFGKNMIAMHHGHKQSKEKLLYTIPSLFPKEWGATDYRYCYSGHVHHSAKSENHGMISESFPTLAAADSYASRLGLTSQAGMTCITYERNSGEYGRIITRPINM